MQDHDWTSFCPHIYLHFELHLVNWIDINHFEVFANPVCVCVGFLQFSLGDVMKCI